MHGLRGTQATAGFRTLGLHGRDGAAVRHAKSRGSSLRRFTAAVGLAFALAGCSNLVREPSGADIHLWSSTKVESAMGDPPTILLSVKSADPSHVLSPRVFPALSVRCSGERSEVWLESGYPAEPELGREWQVTIRYRLDGGSPVSLLSAVGKDRVSMLLGGPELLAKFRQHHSVRVEYTPYQSEGRARDFAFDLTDLPRAAEDGCPAGRRRS